MGVKTKEGGDRGRESDLVNVALDAEALEEVRTNFSQLGVPSVSRAITGNREQFRNRGAWLTGHSSQQDNAICELKRLIHVMGDEKNGGRCRRMDFQQQILHFYAGERVESTKGFIEKEYPRVSGQCPGERCALGHATRDLAGAQVRGGAEADQGEKFADALRAGNRVESAR